jgi:ribosomal protein L12E/L44/L45/RPP1/RPP2
MENLIIVNKNTGEILEENVLIIGRKPYKVDKGFIKIFVTFLYDIVEDESIAGKSIRLLLYMIGKLDYNTYEITIIPQEAIKDLGITKQTFYNWLDTLMEKNIIEKINRYKYRLKPYTAIKGNSKTAAENDLLNNKKEEEKQKEREEKQKEKKERKRSS